MLKADVRSEFDDEAVRAFQAAAPFPDPPEGLAGKDELITFLFSFIYGGKERRVHRRRTDARRDAGDEAQGT